MSVGVGVGVGGGSVGRRPKNFAALRAAEGRSVGFTWVGIGLGRRVGSVGGMLKMLLRTTITPQTTAGLGTSILRVDSVTGWPAASACMLQPDHTRISILCCHEV
eukprot:5735391-Prymnesium_polylepis.1